MAELGEGQRRCVELFYLQGDSYAEVARRSGYALNEVKSHIQNGKRRLRILLSAARRFWPDEDALGRHFQLAVEPFQSVEVMSG